MSKWTSSTSKDRGRDEPERQGGREVHESGEGSWAAEADLAQNRLRERAEVFVEGQEGAWNATLTEHDILRLVHELQVHQVELEIQNEELRQAQLDLAASVERYADLYDFAPIGYLSVSLDGQITRANLAAADMLRVERRHLTGKPLHRYIATEDFEPVPGRSPPAHHRGSAASAWSSGSVPPAASCFGRGSRSSRDWIPPKARCSGRWRSAISTRRNAPSS